MAQYDLLMWFYNEHTKNKNRYFTEEEIRVSSGISRKSLRDNMAKLFLMGYLQVKWHKICKDLLVNLEEKATYKLNSLVEEKVALMYIKEVKKNGTNTEL